MVTIPLQEHTIFKADGRIQKIQLSELFSQYNNGVKQLIRLRPKFYSQAISSLESGPMLSLFNLPDPVNNDLLEKYKNGERSKGLLAEIHGNEGIIQETSLKVVEVLTMENVTQKEIMDGALFQNSLSGKDSMDALRKWLGEEFYEGINVDPNTPLLYRKIQLYAA